MNRGTRRIAPALGLLACALLLAACAGTAPAPSPALPPAETSVRAAPVSPRAARVIRLARSLVGTPYKWGGLSPATGFDCSGLIWYVYHQNGVDLPRMSQQQLGTGAPVGRADIRPGDLVFHLADKDGKSLHVGIVTDRRTFVHAPGSGRRVMESSLDSPFWREHFLSARRVL